MPQKQTLLDLRLQNNCQQSTNFVSLKERCLHSFKASNSKTRTVISSNNFHVMQGKIQKDKKLIIPADKTTNFYRVDPASYKQLLKTNIIKPYKKAPTNQTNKVIAEEKKIAKDLHLDNRINSLAKKECFITMKDHKPNFNNNPTSRHINPSKSEIGIVSIKKILERINNKVVAATGVNQWKNTGAVINWFKDIPDKPTHSFISFDVVDFYPSITVDILTKALAFASNYDAITNQEKQIIIQAINVLLFTNNEAWHKKAED